MRKFFTYFWITLGIGGVMWFIATIDNLNIVPLLGLLLAVIAFPTAAFVGGDYITENLNEEGDEDEEYGTVCDVSELWCES